MQYNIYTNFKHNNKKERLLCIKEEMAVCFSNVYSKIESMAKSQQKAK